MLNKIKELDEQLAGQIRNKKKFHNYYKGKHKILETNTWETRNNTQEVHNYCKLFIDNNTGFLLGNEVQHKYDIVDLTDEENIVDIYNNILGYKAQQLDQRLLRDMQIFGEAYEINYVNKRGEFDIVIANPLELAIDRDGKKVKYGLLKLSDRLVKESRVITYNFFDVEKNNIYTIQKTDGERFSIIGSPVNTPINNPIIVVYNDWEKLSEMTPIMGLNDAYNQVSSDGTSEINDFRHAYMHFRGAKVDENSLRSMNKSGIIETKSDAEIKFITKEVNTDFIELKLTQLEQQIYNMAGQVNFNDTKLGSNTSSLALRNKLTNLINKLKLKEGFLKEAMSIRFKNLSNYLAFSNINFRKDLMDYTKVDTNFLMNIPTSDKETAEMVVSLYNAGLLSRESAISQLSFINKTKEEIERILNEDDDNISFEEVFNIGDIDEVDR